MATGWGTESSTWWAVEPEVAKVTRVCVYDRAGLGMSEDRPQDSVTGKVVVDDLHALLDNAKVEPPYVLVGHSFGGLLVRLFQSQYRDEVEGMVLIDASDEDQFRRLNQPLIWEGEGSAAI